MATPLQAEVVGGETMEVADDGEPMEVAHDARAGCDVPDDGVGCDARHVFAHGDGAPQ